MHTPDREYRMHNRTICLKKRQISETKKRAGDSISPFGQNQILNRLRVKTNEDSGLTASMLYPF